MSDISNQTIIKVIGVGGAGTNAVNRMIATGMSGLEFIDIDFSMLSLKKSEAQIKLQLTSIYPPLTFPEFGDPVRIRNRESAVVGREQITRAIGKVDVVVIVGGMGGGTGSGVAPVIAETAIESGALTIGVVTRPFSFEGRGRAAVAEKGINDLRSRVDTLIVISNDGILKMIHTKEMSVTDAFHLSDDYLRRAVQCIVGLVSTPCLPAPPSYNEAVTDFLRSKKGKPLAGRLGIGLASGKNRIKEAVRMAVTSPLLEEPFKMASAILIESICSPEITIAEISEAANIFGASSKPTTRILYTTTVENSSKSELQITVICLYEQHELRVAV